jgi:hypothetical protein
MLLLKNKSWASIDIYRVDPGNSVLKSRECMCNVHVHIISVQKMMYTASLINISKRAVRHVFVVRNIYFLIRNQQQIWRRMLQFFQEEMIYQF